MTTFSPTATGDFCSSSRSIHNRGAYRAIAAFQLERVFIRSSACDFRTRPAPGFGRIVADDVGNSESVAQWPNDLKLQKHV